MARPELFTAASWRLAAAAFVLLGGRRRRRIRPSLELLDCDDMPHRRGLRFDCQARRRAEAVEEALRRVEDRAALLRFLADRAADSPVTAEPAVFTGLGDIFGEIEDTIRVARASLSPSALCVELRRGGRLIPPARFERILDTAKSASKK